MAPTVSVIIPCYNSGMFLGEALDSVRSYKGSTAYEVIIVDDGSTDPKTLAFLNDLAKEGHGDLKMLYRENGGPGAARNTGIKNAAGEYILFLDSDNKIRPAYIDRGVEVLKQRKDVGVVYGDVRYFGDTSKEEVSVPDFDATRLFGANFIDMCTMIRKKVWEDVQGFDEDRKVMGFEDWEFWIRVHQAHWTFYHVAEVLFDYRVRPQSMLKEAREPERYHEMLRYVYAKHLDLFIANYTALYEQYKYYKHDQQKPLRSLVKFFYKKHFGRP